MCEYRELRISEAPPIMRAMQAQELKSLVESGTYKPDPGEIATAMLSRRGVRELLTAPASLSAAGRTPRSPATPRQAA
jgi:hypothetical protein